LQFYKNIMSTDVATVGIDLGATKTVIIANDGDLVLTSTGSVSRPSIVCFDGKSRCIDEEASAVGSASSIVKSFSSFLEQTNSTSQKTGNDSNGCLTFPIRYNDEETNMSVSALLGMFLAGQMKRIDSVYPHKPKIAFILAPNATATSSCTIKQACCVAGIDLDRVCTVNKVEALKIAYTRKVQALQPSERTALEGKKAVVIEMGAAQTTAILVDVKSLDAKNTPLFAKGGPTVIKSVYDAALGASDFDMVIFNHFAKICEEKHQTPITFNSKRGKRLIAGCERVRKLLSQLPEAAVTVENLTDNGDVNFKLTRDELKRLGEPLLKKFQNLMNDLFEDMSEIDLKNVGGVEVLGGGARMVIVQTIICEIFKENQNINNTTSGGISATSSITQRKTLGAKLDDGAVALGGALICKNQLEDNKIPAGEEEEKNSNSSDALVYVPVGSFTSADIGAPDGVIGYSTEEVKNQVDSERAMQVQDADIIELLFARNNMEAFLLDCKGFKHQKYGTAEYIDIPALDKTIDEHESWMYDEDDASLSDVTSKFSLLHDSVYNNLCKKYFEQIENDKKRVEEEMNKEAEKAAAEKVANPEEDQDQDNRKLKKADRMRLVVKNKEEATEIFKGGVYKTACARYSKALSHTTKFFDLSPEDEKEVTAIKVSLYLNIALCYLKMNNNEQVLNNCNHALNLDNKSAKAYFRRSAAYEAKGDLEKALEDAKSSQAESVVADKAVTQTIGRLTKAIAKQKQSEKKMWGKAFG
jgi:molecular chaperone DnaK (HSP70)